MKPLKHGSEFYMVRALPNAALARYLKEHERLIRLAAGYVLWHASGTGRPVKIKSDEVVGGVVGLLQRYYNMDMRPYRVRTILSTAAQRGAFEGYGVYLRSGVGFTTVPKVSDAQLLETGREAA
jgi:phage shock protein PspC (stress-responsive transcriptional regulator)